MDLLSCEDPPVPTPPNPPWLNSDGWEDIAEDDALVRLDALEAERGRPKNVE